MLQTIVQSNQAVAAVIYPDVTLCLVSTLKIIHIFVLISRKYLTFPHLPIVVDIRVIVPSHIVICLIVPVLLLLNAILLILQQRLQNHQPL